MSVHWSSRTVPGDATVKEQAGLVFGCCVTPFADVDTHDHMPYEMFNVSEVGR